MKKAVTLLALMAGVGLALGQGSVVSFNNNGVTVGGDHKVYFDFVGNGAGVSGTNYVAELYYLNAGSLTPFAASISKFRATSTTLPGTWSGKTVTLPVGGIDVPLTLDVRVYDAVAFGSYEQAVAARLSGVNTYTGESGNFAFTQIVSVPPANSDNQLVNMPAFALINTPEPSAIALAVMGVAGLLLIRRRK
jgi:MYXO-CTERM domain-containing protein